MTWIRCLRRLRVGHGHSNAADHLADYLRLHHPETFQKVVREVAADLSGLTGLQLLGLGRSALTARLAG